MNRHEHLRLFVIAADSLTHGNELHAGKVQTLENRKSIFRGSRETAGVVDEDRCKRGGTESAS
jgi:hypothetical protein